MKKTKLFLPLLLFAILTIVFITGCSTNNREDYSFGGSTTLEPIFTTAIESFSPKGQDVKLSYDAQGSSAGIKGLQDGIYTLAGASRELKDEEKSEGIVSTPIAIDGIAIIINEDAGVSNLTLEQVANIFAGDIDNWSQVGGNDMEITVINRDEASGTRSAFKEMVLDSVLGRESDPQFVEEAIVTDSNGDMVVKAGSTPGGVGYCGFGYIEEAKNAGAVPVSIDEIEATEENVIDGKYPISRKLNIIHREDLAKDSIEAQFIDFLLSSDGQAIVEENGFIGLEEE